MAYPPGPEKLVNLPDLAGGQAPGDPVYLVDLSAGTNRDRKSSLNDLFAEITKNITDISVQFGDGAAATVSAAGKGKVRYNNSVTSYQVSENGGAYQNLLKGSGTATRVAFWSAADELSSDAAFYWQNTDKRLGIGVGTTPLAPLDVLADGTAIAQQWRQNGGSMRMAVIMDSVPEASIGTTTNHTLHLLSNNLQRLTVENGGLVGINKASAVQAQLQVVSQDATTETLILNSAASPSANIAELYNDSSRRFAFSPAGNLDIGLSGAGGATGSITLNGVTSGAVTVNVASAAGTWTLTLPTTDGNAGEFLQTNGSGVTTWAAAGGGTPGSPVNSVQFNDAGSFAGDSALLWDKTNDRLLIGVAVASGAAPLDVLADGTAIAQQWRQNGGSMRMAVIMDSVPEASIGTTTNHTLHLLSNNLQRLTVENGGLVGINKASAVQAQLQVVSQDATTETLILNSAASPSANIAEFYNDSSRRFAFSPAGNLDIGLSGAGGATGSITLNGVTSGAVTVNVASAAGTWTLTLPTTDGNAGEFLQTNGSGVTTWAAAGGGTPGSPVNSVQFNDAGAFAGDSALLWDKTNDRLLIGVSVASGAAPLDILADGTAIAQQWRQNGGSMRMAVIMDSVPEASIGTTTNHTLHLLSNNLQRLTVENGGLIGINKASAVQAQLQVVAQDATTEALILNSAASPSANIAEFYNDSSRRFAFSPAGNLDIGLSGAGGATGSITLNGVTSGAVTVNVAAAAGTWTLTLPTTDGNAGEFLQTNGSGVTTWATVSATPGGSNTQLQYNNAGAFGGISGATSDGTNATFGSGNLRATLPQITTGVNDANGLRILAFSPAASAINNFTISSTASTAADLTLSATGTDSNIGISILAKGISNPSKFRGGTTDWFLQVDNSTGFQVGDATNRYYIQTSFQAKFGSGISMGFTSTTSATGSLDTFLRRSAAAHFAFGAADAASPVAQTLSVQNVVAGTSNTAGVNWTFNASRGTGTGAGGAFIWQVAPAGGSGTAQNALSASMRLASTQELSIYTGTAPNVWTSGNFKAQLYLISDTLPAVGVAAHFSATALDAPQWQMLRGRGTNASPTAIQANDSIGNIEFWGQTSTATNNVVAGARIRVSATENWSAGNNGCQMIFYTSNNAGTITDRMYLKETGTVRIGATSGSYDTTNLLQVGNYASFATGVLASLYTGANGTKGLQVIGTNGATANLIEVFRDALTPNLLTLTAAGVMELRAGLNTGTTVARVGGTINENLTSTANSGTGETDLQTYSLPANTLGTDGDYLRIECWGTFEASVNNKTLKAKLGTSTLFDTGAQAFAPATAVAWRLTVTIVRTAVSGQSVISQFAAGGSVLTSTVQSAGPAENLSTALTFKLTGQGGASNEIFQDGMVIQYHPNNL